MSHYRSNLRDLEFTLFEVFGRGDVLGHGPLRGRRRRHRAGDAARGRPAGRARARREPARLRPQPARLRPGDAHRDACPSRSRSRTRPTSTSGSGPSTSPPSWAARSCPPSLRWAVNELILGVEPRRRHVRRRASPSPSCSTSSAPTSRRSSPSSWSTRSGPRRWSSPSRTPAPTSARAAPRRSSNADGTWNITGVKRFITSAETDLVRQRRPLRAGPPRGRRAGHQGPVALRRPQVPLVDLETGELGERNGAVVTNVEHKMGLKVSTTCEVTLRRRRPRRSAPCSATSTTASPRCSASSSTPG